MKSDEEVQQEEVANSAKLADHGWVLLLIVLATIAATPYLQEYLQEIVRHISK